MAILLSIQNSESSPGHLNDRENKGLIISVYRTNSLTLRTMYTQYEEERILRDLKHKREIWLTEFLKDNDPDGDIMDAAIEEATDRMKVAISKNMVWPKFVKEFAGMIIRQAYGCPHA